MSSVGASYPLDAKGYPQVPRSTAASWRFSCWSSAKIEYGTLLIHAHACKSLVPVTVREQWPSGAGLSSTQREGVEEEDDDESTF